MSYRSLAFLVLMCGPVLAPDPAYGHGESLVESSNYFSEIVDVRPPIPGVVVAVDNGTERLILDNLTSSDIVVLGYDGEPYLRVGADGVYANRLSPAFYLNRTRDGDAPLPNFVDPKALPKWEKQSSSSRAAWHDHRTHWMLQVEPPQVRAAPHRPSTVIDAWNVPVRHGNTETAVVGRLSWVPPPNPWPWIAGSLGMTALLVGMFTWVPRLLSVGLLVLIAVDFVHRIGLIITIPTSGIALATEIVETAIPSLLAWAAGARATLLWRRGDQSGLWFAIFCGAAIAFVGGIAQVDDFMNSQVPFAFGVAPARILSALSVAFGAAVVGAAAWRLILQSRTPAPAQNNSVLDTK